MQLRSLLCMIGLGTPPRKWSQSSGTGRACSAHAARRLRRSLDCILRESRTQSNDDEDKDEIDFNIWTDDHPSKKRIMTELDKLLSEFDDVGSSRSQRVTTSELREWLGVQARVLDSPRRLDLIEVFTYRARLSQQVEAEGGVSIRIGYAYGHLSLIHI